MDQKKYPTRIKVKNVISGRYKTGSKPVSWDERIHGQDVIIDSEENEVTLSSTGDQSTPAPGWEILLTQYDEKNKGVQWTLYGIPRNN